MKQGIYRSDKTYGKVQKVINDLNKKYDEIIKKEVDDYLKCAGLEAISKIETIEGITKVKPRVDVNFKIAVEIHYNVIEEWDELIQ